MSISGLRKASWYNPDDGTVVQANNIAEDGEFYTRAIEDPDDQTPTGESPYAGDESYCELMVFDMSLLPQLKAWQESDTRISMVAAGVQQNIQWYERDLVNVKPVYPLAAGRRNHINVVMERIGHGAHDIYGHVNLLAHLGTTADPWVDEDGDGSAEGYGVYSATNLQFSSNTQQFDTLSDGSDLIIQVNENLQFPIEGQEVTFSAEHTSVHPSETNNIYLRQDSFGFSTLHSKENSFISTGRHLLQLKTKSNMFYFSIIRPMYVLQSNSEETVKLKFPVLRVDGSEKYVSY
jgi:hypothetical protein